MAIKEMFLKLATSKKGSRYCALVFDLGYARRSVFIDLTLGAELMGYSIPDFYALDDNEYDLFDGASVEV